MNLSLFKTRERLLLFKKEFYINKDQRFKHFSQHSSGQKERNTRSLGIHPSIFIFSKKEKYRKKENRQPKGGMGGRLRYCGREAWVSSSTVENNDGDASGK